MSKGFIRSLLFNRDDGWTVRKAKAWAKSKGYSTKTVEISKDNIRLVQSRRDAQRYRYKTFGKGIKALFGYNDDEEETIKNPREHLSEIITIVKIDGEWEVYIPFLNKIIKGKSIDELINAVNYEIETRIGYELINEKIIEESPEEIIIKIDIEDLLSEVESRLNPLQRRLI